MEQLTEHASGDVEETAGAVLARLDELVVIARRIDTRLQGLERPTWVPADQGPFPRDPEIGRPRRLTLTRALTEAARGGVVNAVDRAGAT